MSAYTTDISSNMTVAFSLSVHPVAAQQTKNFNRRLVASKQDNFRCIEHRTRVTPEGNCRVMYKQVESR